MRLLGNATPKNPEKPETTPLKQKDTERTRPETTKYKNDFTAGRERKKGLSHIVNGKFSGLVAGAGKEGSTPHVGKSESGTGTGTNIPAGMKRKILRTTNGTAHIKNVTAKCWKGSYTGEGR